MRLWTDGAGEIGSVCGMTEIFDDATPFPEVLPPAKLTFFDGEVIIESGPNMVVMSREAALHMAERIKAEVDQLGTG